MRSRLYSFGLLLLGLATFSGTASAQASGHTVMAVFAHPDDERIVGPLLARLAREHERVVWVIATDGSKGVTKHAGIPAGPHLAEVRAGESRCAAERLGIQPPIMLGLEDAGLASFASLGRLRQELVRLVNTHRPDVVLTIGPEGGTGHPDHRLVGNVITEVVQGLAWPEPPALYYASLPAERMRDAPAARPRVTPLPERYLPVQVAFTPEDLDAARASFDCHASQYTQEQREAIDRYLAFGFDGRVWLRPWFGSAERRTELFRPADTLVVAPPASVGMDPALRARLDSVLANGIAYGAAPGAELAVGRYGRLVYMGGAGRLDPAAGSPAPNDSTLWDLASLTKVIGTTTAAMMLEEAGKLDLDRPVRYYLPEIDAPDKAGITVRMMLEHRSGFPLDIFFWKPTPGDSTPMQRINAASLLYPPNDSSVYSNQNLILTAKIVERLTGTTLDRFLLEHVWRPLGMHDTGFNPLLPPGEELPADTDCTAALSRATPARLARIAPTEIDTVYRHMHVHGIVHDEAGCALGGVAGHAGLFSSARDLAKFAQMMLNGGEYGGVQLLHPSTIARWTARRRSDSSRATGWDTPSGKSSAGRYFSPRSFGHTGFTGTSIWVDPQRGLFVVLLTNRVNPTRDNPRIFRLRREVADAVQESILDAPLIDWEARR